MLAGKTHTAVTWWVSSGGMPGLALHLMVLAVNVDTWIQTSRC
jgi:hypothetical protein